MERKSRIGLVYTDLRVLQKLRLILGPVFEIIECMSTAADFVNSPVLTNPDCLVLELPDCRASLNRLDLVKSEAPLLPIVAICNQASARFAIAAMKRGVLDFLLEPIDATTLLECVSNAVARRKRLQANWLNHKGLASSWDQLSSQEKSVVRGIAAGESIKEIAARMDMSVRTIHIRRKRAMAKLGANNRAELLTLAYDFLLHEGSLENGLAPAHAVAPASHTAHKDDAPAGSMQLSYIVDRCQDDRLKPQKNLATCDSRFATFSVGP